MTTPFPILLVLDLSAIMASKTREWQEFSRVGTCYLPDVVLEEIQFLCDRAVESEEEQTAREFIRFQPKSGWQPTDITLSHPALRSGTVNTLSKKARLSLEVGECAYGLSEASALQLVVLVTNDQLLLQHIQRIGATNLCGVTMAALLQWARVHQKPPGVMQHLKAMQGNLPGMADPSHLPRSPSSQSPFTTGAPASIRRPRRRSAQPSALSQIFSGLIVLLGITIGVLFAWRLIQPTNFNKFWKQMGLPALPGDPPARKPR
ncbi:hypothetical protein BST81_15105 [Leptolyngbya sp. 'hensonii']|uniref:PIN domain-containing protein n=1 Tax=Leptolyngbya sp. 'hensonii' TaxID=1922337 RepID=UPI00094FF9ED|nr:PIN domain-containing protein [Leptolyngbya sp. 'hensonii']OLP17649.1 hypothetical protein BST81_15105 [Leptolyngbya sp. 'hensonii']